jgi:hypothetical protein
MPPFGAPPRPSSLPKWEVTIPWHGQAFVRTISTSDEKTALNKAVLELAQAVNLIPKRVFQRVMSERAYNVKKLTSAVVQINQESDRQRMKRLPNVFAVNLSSEQEEGQTNWIVLLPLNNTLVDTRILTSDLQNLFGVRLRSSGPTQVKFGNHTYSAIRIRLT